MNEHGFIMFNRTPETDELLRDPLAFALLAQIAKRARWRTAFSSTGLEVGEALIGDYKSLGMTRAQYRKRVDRLKKCQLITIRTTNKGTIAKLISPLVFDINLPANGQRKNHQQDQQKTNAEPSENHQKTNGEPLTNKETRKEGVQGKRECKKLSIWEAKERIAAIVKEISDINLHGDNWLCRSLDGGGYVSSRAGGTLSYNDKQLKPEAKDRLAELMRVKQEAELFLKGV